MNILRSENIALEQSLEITEMEKRLEMLIINPAGITAERSALCDLTCDDVGYCDVVGCDDVKPNPSIITENCDKTFCDDVGCDDVGCDDVGCDDADA